MADIENDAAHEAESGMIVDPRRLHEAARIAEALVFASAGPVSQSYIADRLPRGVDVLHVLRELKGLYAGRGVNLVQVDDGWAFRTAPDMSFVIRTDETEVRKLSRAALEVLSIIAYHQPVTRAEIEEIRGVAVSKGTLDQLIEMEWVRIGRRRQTPGRPVTFVVTETFLDHFGLESARDLPGLAELRAAGLLESRPAGELAPMLFPSEEGEDDAPGLPADDLFEDE